jgi:hypothetical protein
MRDQNAKVRARTGGRQLTSQRLLIGFSVLIAMLTIAGAVSFVRYTQRHQPDPQLAAVAPFDIFVPGLEPWRVRLAERLTAQLDSTPPLAAVSQDVVRERWQGQARPVLAAMDLARRTSAGLAIYGRVDPIATSRDSVRVQMILVGSGDGRVLLTSDRPWAVADLDTVPRALAQQVRQNYRYPRD